MKIILFISGTRGIEVLKHIAKNKVNYKINLVVTEKFKNLHEVKKFDIQNIFIKDNVNEESFLNTLKKLNSDLSIVAGFPTIFKNNLLNLNKFGVLNLHGGPLPFYRGGSPLNWQIINDEPKIGVSIIKMDSGIDTGPIIKSSFFKINDYDDINTVHIKANKSFTNLIIEILDEIEKKGSIRLIKQEETEAIYWSQRKENEGKIFWRQMTARNVFNLIRALKPPYPCAFTTIKGEKILISECKIPNEVIKSTPGKFFHLQKIGHYFMCKDRAILIKDLEKIPLSGFCDD